MPTAKNRNTPEQFTKLNRVKALAEMNEADVASIDKELEQHERKIERLESSVERLLQILSQVLPAVAQTQKLALNTFPELSRLRAAVIEPPKPRRAKQGGDDFEAFMQGLMPEE